MNIHNLSRKEMESLHSLLSILLDKNGDEKEPVDEMIDEIMDEFNFATVHKAMVALDWKWAVTSNNNVPTMDELRKEAERLLRDAADIRLDMFRDEPWESPVYCNTGGFSAAAWCNEDKTKITRLDLDFIVSTWSARIGWYDK